MVEPLLAGRPACRALRDAVFRRGAFRVCDRAVEGRVGRVVAYDQARANGVVAVDGDR